MIRKAKPGETAVLPGGAMVTIQQVYRAADKRVTICTTPDNQWHTAWELRRPKGTAKQ